MAVVIILAAIALLVIGYIFYGSWLAKQWGIDPSRKTPAYTMSDGVDYVAAKPAVLMGHHFSSIAGAGPINGPIQAAVFGWVPVFLWCVLGGIFFGGVHDFGALFASARHDGKYVGEILGDTMGEKAKTQILAQAHAIRGYYYLYLSQNFGRVPMLLTGESYSSSASKPRPESTEAAFTLILEDLDFAAKNLDWTPVNGEYGRFTKGAALGYQALAYMYLKDYATAKSIYKQIIDSKTYELLPCFGEIHQVDNYWSKESVWEVAFYKWSNLGWGATGSTEDVWWGYYLTASPEYGGWGGTFASYEFCRSFEPGDKRRQYSVVGYGETHPYTGQVIGANTGEWVTDDNMPNNYVIKLWKKPNGNPVFTPISATHMRYSSILLNYAECCFETGDAATGWDMIAQVRNRAWGNLEVGKTPSAEFSVSTLKYNDAIVEVPDAQTYYTQYKRTKGYSADVWKVALTIERRHEFVLEYEFWYDLTRTGMAKDFLDAEYPKNNGERYTADGLPRTPRTFDYDPNKELYPIPTLEILTNAEINPEDQNPGY